MAENIIQEVDEMDNNLDLDLKSLDSFDSFNKYDIPMSPHANLYNSDIDIAYVDISDVNSSDSNSESENDDQGDEDEDTPMINPEWTKEYSNFDVPLFTADTGPADTGTYLLIFLTLLKQHPQTISSFILINN